MSSFDDSTHSFVTLPSSTDNSQLTSALSKLKPNEIQKLALSLSNKLWNRRQQIQTLNSYFVSEVLRQTAARVTNDNLSSFKTDKSQKRRNKILNEETETSSEGDSDSERARVARLKVKESKKLDQIGDDSQTPMSVAVKNERSNARIMKARTLLANARSESL